MPIDKRQTRGRAASLDLLSDHAWQMSYGERAALEGLLCALKPSLAVEIGTAEGGSLERVAAFSREVHGFDINFDHLAPALRDADHVVLHGGDSHELLPDALATFAREGRNVDFVLVDGDHSSDGVRRDVEDLLASDALADTVIVLHDTMNEIVRCGLRAVSWHAEPKVAYVDLDFVPGDMFRDPNKDELWGGLGLVVVDALSPRPRDASPFQSRYYEAYDLVTRARAVQADLARHREWLLAIESSASWRVTRPLRRLKGWAARNGRSGS